MRRRKYKVLLMRKPNHLMATFWAVLILGAGLTGCKTPQQDVAKYKYLLDDKNTTVADRAEHAVPTDAVGLQQLAGAPGARIVRLVGGGRCCRG